MKIFTAMKYIFTVIGVSLLISAMSDYNTTRSLLDAAVSAEGTVVDLQESSGSSGSLMYTPVIQFVDNAGKTVEFMSSVSSNPPSYARDEKVEVLYSPHDSQDVIINSFFEKWGGAVITAILGISFFSGGALIFLTGMLKGRKKIYLQRNGVLVNAKFQSVQLNHSLSVNGRHPYMIVCQWTNPANYCIHIFESENIWFDPSDFITTEEIKVFTDKRNSKKYYVDVSFLPKVAR